MPDDSKRKYTPKHTRQQNAFDFIFTERDQEIVRAVNQFRYLKTEQIKRLFFPNAKTTKNTAKRLKYLFHAGFLGRLIPFEQAGNGGASCAYYVDKKGAEFLKENGELALYRPKSGQVKQMFMNHALDVSEFRINLELSLKDHPVFTIRDTVLDFEIKQGMEKALGNDKYKLYKKIEVVGTKKTYQVYPDLRFVLQGQGKYEHLQALYFVEIDRGTMDLGRIQEKVVGYKLFDDGKYFNNLGIGTFRRFTVLIQTSSERRAKNIVRSLQGVEGRHLVLVTHHALVNENSIFQEEIWRSDKNEKKSIFKKRNKE